MLSAKSFWLFDRPDIPFLLPLRLHLFYGNNQIGGSIIGLIRAAVTRSTSKDVPWLAIRRRVPSC